MHVAVTAILQVSSKALAAGKSTPVSAEAQPAGNSPIPNDSHASSSLKRVRDQFKANGTRVLKKFPELSAREKIWTKGGDIQIIDTDEDWEQVLLYILVAQDRMERDA